MNAWPWTTKLPFDLSCPSWTGNYLNQQAINLGINSSNSSSNRSETWMIRPKQVLKAQVSYTKEFLKCTWSPLLLYCLSLPAPPLDPCGVPYDQLTEEDKTFLQIVLHDIQAAFKNGELQHCSSALGHPWGRVVRGNHPCVQNFQQYLVAQFA